MSLFSLLHGQMDSKPHVIKALVELCIKTVINENVLAAALFYLVALVSINGTALDSKF